MTDLRDMPPDPFEREGIDPFAVEAAEKLAREDAHGSDPRWDRLGAEPTLEDFEDAALELHACDDDEIAGECSTGPFTALTPWLSAIAVLVVIAMVLVYVFR